MRSIKLAPAIAAAAALLAVLPASAAARVHSSRRHPIPAGPRRHPIPAGPRRHPSAVGNCRVSLAVAPRHITTGETVTAFGHLACARSVLTSGQPVEIFEHVAGTPSFVSVGTATTDPGGFYQFTPPVPTANTVFYATSLGSQSARRPVNVAARVSISGPPDGSQLFTGRGAHGAFAANAVTFKGTVSPNDVGATVALQREDAITGEQWRRIGHLGVVGPGGSYSITHSFIVPGAVNIRVVVLSHGVNAPSPSEALSYEISQAQNPKLTILSSADPVAFGQPVTISGEAPGSPNQPLTLLAHTRTGTFAPVAKTTTDGSGKYAFPAQTPLQSSFYRVSGAGTSSAVLFEGVQYLLTAQVSATTVAAGQALTFTGTVAPGVVGHPVYLQRQNSIGGFQPVDVGTVTAGSTFTIVHAVFGPGTKVFRVKIPGDSQNQGKASQTFTVTVTPAPAASLAPEAPGDSGSPSPGKL